MSRYKDDLTGRKYGRLLVLEYAGNAKWKCMCDCGTVTTINTSQLKTGKTRSCGCFNKEQISSRNTKNIEGQRFGNLVAVRRVGTKNHQHIWECYCDCGSVVRVYTRSLISGNTKSCGCYARKRTSETHKTHGMSTTKEYIKWKTAKRRHMSYVLDCNWTLEMDKCIRDVFDCCVVCGISEKEHQDKYKSSLEIDHVYPLSLGYGLEPGNATVLCKRCNVKKFKRTVDNLPIQVANKIILSAELFKLIWNNYEVKYSYTGSVS